MEELREEIKTVMAENGGQLDFQAVSSMKYLDSVMKESQRVNPGVFGK